jgi:ATP synthase protein I
VTPVEPNADATADVAVTGNEAWAIVSRLLAGMLLYGAMGWALGSWLGNTTAGLAIGVMLGVLLGLYLSLLRIRQLGEASTPALVVSGSQSWSARMTRARMDRANEGGND